MRRSNILFLTQFSILLAIEAVFCFTPLGSIPIGPVVATLAMLPVIMTAILLGTKAGTAMGFTAGLFSLIIWSFMPPTPAVAFAFSPFYSLGELQGNFWSLVICLVPRALCGTVTGLVFHGMKKGRFAATGRFALSAALGSLTNTVGVLGGIWLVFGDAYASALGGVILTIVLLTLLTNGIPEVIVSALTGLLVCKPLHKALKRP